jgi:hypothetical protein
MGGYHAQEILSSMTSNELRTAGGYTIIIIIIVGEHSDWRRKKPLVK